MKDFSGKKVCRFLLTSLVGSGASGSVYKAIDATLPDSPLYAIKCVPQSRNSKRRRQEIAEINNHDVVADCPHVLALIDVFEQDGHFFHILPLCETDLFRTIWRDKLYWRNDALIKEAFVEILDGVHACHKKGVFHRDLKPENIMCNKQGRDIRIGDFGLSSNRRVCRDGGCGTVNYMSPECLDAGEVVYYADTADVWSLGVILFNMVTGQCPWEEARLSDKNFFTYMTDDEHLFRTSSISEGLSVLLDQMWHPLASRRPRIPVIREAVLSMDTFYKARRSTRSRWSLSKEIVSSEVDSQQTRVALAAGPEEKETNRMGLKAKSCGLW